MDEALKPYLTQPPRSLPPAATEVDQPRPRDDALT